MEQTIERDLSKAMAGLRDQFRQPDEQAAGPSSLELVRGQVPRADTAAIAEFRSEAAAARDEMLDGLARLRRELEVQRRRAGGPATLEPSMGMREELLALTTRVEALEAMLARAKEHPSILRAGSESSDREAESARGRGMCIADSSGGSASLQELADALTIERSARHAQASELRARLIEELHEQVALATGRLRADVEQRVEVLAVELRAEMYAAFTADMHGGAGSSPVATTVPVAAVSFTAPAVASLPTRAFDLSIAQWSNSGAGEKERGHSGGPSSESGTAPGPQTLISEDLKESLEQLVQKVNKTLKECPHPGEGPPPRFLTQPPTEVQTPTWLPEVTPPVPHPPHFAAANPLHLQLQPRPELQGQQCRSVQFPVPQCGGAGNAAAPGVRPGRGNSVVIGAMPPAAYRLMSSPVMAKASIVLAGASPMLGGNTPTPGAGVLVVTAAAPKLAPAWPQAPTSPQPAGEGTPWLQGDDRFGSRDVSKDMFKRCIQELREENAALRAGQWEAATELGIASMSPSRRRSNSPVLQKAWGGRSVTVAGSARAQRSMPGSREAD